ncbi:MAG: TolC family protein [Lachnospiraceae bacterium]|nr:TolC family protein [Lachnospiraceae bacterium]
MKKPLMAAVLAAALTISGSGPQVMATGTEQSAQPVLTPAQTLALVLADDNEYLELSNQLAVQTKDYKQAVSDAGGSDEEEYLWSVLARVTLSQEESLSEYYSAVTLPVLLEAGMQVTQAQMNSREYELESEITGLYIQITTCQERISTQEELLKEKETSLTKKKALVKSGQADSSEAEALSEEAEALSESLEKDKSALEAAIEKLSEYMGEEIKEDALTVEINVEETDWDHALEELTGWAINNDEAYLSAWEVSLEVLLSLWTDYTVLNEEYAIPDSIFEYIVSAGGGEAIDTDAFYEEYTLYWQERTAALENLALTQTEDPSDPEDTSGSGDASDPGETEAAEETAQTEEEASIPQTEEEDIYALYDAVLEYQNTVLELENQALAVTESVEEAYNDLLSLRDTYTELQEQLQELQSNQKLYRVRYRMGELSKEDYESLTEEQNTLQLDILDAESQYLQAYVSLNSVTNGGLSALLAGELEAAPSQEEDTIAQAEVVLSIRAYPGEQKFSLNVTVEEEYADEIASFELWNGEVLVGSRTEVDETLFAASLNSTEELEIRFYDQAGGLLGAFEVDPSVPVSVLGVKTGYEMK